MFFLHSSSVFYKLPYSFPASQHKFLPLQSLLILSQTTTITQKLYFDFERFPFTAFSVIMHMSAAVLNGRRGSYTVAEREPFFYEPFIIYVFHSGLQSSAFISTKGLNAINLSNLVFVL